MKIRFLELFVSIFTELLVDTEIVTVCAVQVKYMVELHNHFWSCMLY